MSQGNCNTVAQNITRSESYRTGSSWLLNLLRDYIQSSCPREDNLGDAEPRPQPWGGSTGAFPKPLQNLPTKKAVKGMCLPWKITLDVSDTPAAVLKNCGFLTYDKHLNPWKRETATCSWHSDVSPSQKGTHIQTLTYTALSWATNTNEVQAKGIPSRPPCI